MVAAIPPRLEREVGATAAEWARSVATATAGMNATIDEASATLALDGGTLRIDWSPLPPRRIARLELPRIAVRFTFDGVAAEARAGFMQRFDLSTHRGGG